jgi:hypothetical protein
MIEKIATVTPYQGVVADLAELTATEAYPAGSIFHAVDTGDEYVRYADGWVLDLRKARAIVRAAML